MEVVGETSLSAVFAPQRFQFNYNQAHCSCEGKERFTWNLLI